MDQSFISWWSLTCDQTKMLGIRFIINQSSFVSKGQIPLQIDSVQNHSNFPENSGFFRSPHRHTKTAWGIQKVAKPMCIQTEHSCQSLSCEIPLNRWTLNDEPPKKTRGTKPNDPCCAKFNPFNGEETNIYERTFKNAKTKEMCK